MLKSDTKNNNGIMINEVPVCIFKALPIIDQDSYTKIHITKEMVKKVLTDISEENASIVAEELNKLAQSSHLDNELRLSHFFGQLNHESSKGKKIDEDLKFSKKTLLGIFSYYRDKKHRKELDHDVSLTGLERDKTIANKIYEHRNGNKQPGDGYKFHGRGFIQITEYTAFNKWFHQHYDENIDFIKNPEKVSEPKYAIIASIYYWGYHKLYRPADKNDSNGVSYIINSGDIGTFPKRKQYTDKNLNSGIFSEDKIKSFDADLYQKDLRYILTLPGCISLPSSFITAGLYSNFLNAEHDSSPLIIDLDGDGVKSIALKHSSVFFDLDNDGFAEKTAWVGPHDGLLVRDLNHNGSIDNGSELFGNHTFCDDGQLAHNGFEALQSYQNDGLLTASSSPKLQYLNEIFLLHD